MRKTLAVIPARYKSSRFEGKPLAVIEGRPMIVHVYDAVAESKLFDKVIVATDDRRIYEVVEKFGGRCVMTSDKLRNGTERVAQVLDLLEQQNEYFDIVVNIQGDEPLIKKEMIAQILKGFEQNDAQIVTLKKLIDKEEDIEDPNVVKVVSSGNRALYFSRSKVPFNRDEDIESLIKKQIYYKHIGIYGYKTDILKRIVRLEESPLEKVERLEQLRWLENGYEIIAMTTLWDTVGVDTKEDLEKVIELLKTSKTIINTEQ